MLENFDESLILVLVHEGGFANHPKDPGGTTNEGITQRVYSAYLALKGLKDKSVRFITDEQVREIYKEQYWDKIRGDDLPYGLDYALFDFAVNSGVSRAVKYIQSLVGVATDGILGKVTLQAILAKNDIETLIIDLCLKRWNFVQRLKTFKYFGKGWKRRIHGEVIGSQMTDHGVIDYGIRMFKKDRSYELPRQSAAGKADEVDIDKTKTPEAAGIGVAGIGTSGSILIETGQQIGMLGDYPVIKIAMVALVLIGVGITVYATLKKDTD